MANLNLRTRRSANQAAGHVYGESVKPVGYDVERLLPAPAASAVDAKINAGPVVDRNDRRHRRLDRKIGRRNGASHQDSREGRRKGTNKSSCHKDLPPWIPLAN